MEYTCSSSSGTTKQLWTFSWPSSFSLGDPPTEPRKNAAQSTKLIKLQNIIDLKTFSIEHSKSNAICVWTDPMIILIWWTSCNDMAQLEMRINVSFHPCSSRYFLFKCNYKRVDLLLHHTLKACLRETWAGLPINAVTNYE